MSVVENINRSYEELGQVELGGIKLEEASPSLLDVSRHDLDIHVAMQPSALAYYGALLSEAIRNLEYEEKKYKLWRQRMYGKAKAELSSGKPTVGDVESAVAVDNEKEIEMWEKKLKRLRHEEDTLRVWFDAWKQKSFSLREYIMIETDERKGGSSGTHYTGRSNGNDFSDAGESTKKRESSIERVRSLIRKNQKGT